MYKLHFVLAVLLSPMMFSQTQSAIGSGYSHASATGHLTITITLVPSVAGTLDLPDRSKLVGVRTGTLDAVGGSLGASPSTTGITYLIPSRPATTEVVEVVRPYYLENGRRTQIGVLRTLTVVAK